jgi:uncharacterized protein YndB with AHSA1/START domain
MPDTNPAPAVVIERTFDAPVELIWKLWTEPEHFKAWYGPEEASVPVAKMDLRVGGQRLISMEAQTPNGPMQMWFTGEYRALNEHQLLVYTEAVSDESGNAMSDMTEVRIEFEALGDRTRLVLTHVGIPAESPGAVGWNAALAKLAAYAEGRRDA